MDKYLAEEIIACLPEGKTFFHYFKDRYALMLLSRIVGAEKVRITDLKRTCFANLLDKPLVKGCLANLGNGIVTSQALEDYWPLPTETFLLSLDIWGDYRARERTWCQTTRTGYNLVLQLNFSQKHNKSYQKLIKPRVDDVFYHPLHPVTKANHGQLRRETLAWVRIDLDLASEEALIEEIQSDWISFSHEVIHQVYRCKDQESVPWYGIEGSLEDLKTYFQQVLRPYMKIWDEAMLAAAIAFIRDELGLRTIYYHDFVTGAALKGITGTKPPKSLYTHLPRRFCFQKVTEVPYFLRDEKTVRRSLKKVNSPCWFRLNL